MREASVFVDLHRLPELIVRVPAPAGRGADAVPGRVRAAGVGGGRGVHAPVRRRWGCRSTAARARSTFLRPVLPPSVPALRITGLQVGSGRVDLLLENHPHDVGITVLRRDGDARVVVIK